MLPDAALEEAVAAIARDRSLLDPTRANRRSTTCCATATWPTWRDERGERADGADRLRRLARPGAQRLAGRVTRCGSPASCTRGASTSCCFVNGIPLVLLEFKEPNRPVRAAYDENLTRLPRHDPAALLAERVRDPLERVGGAGRRDVRAVGAASASGSGSTPSGTRGAVELETAIRGTCEPARLLDLVENFVAYIERPGGLVKSLARNHQVLRCERGDRGARADPRDGRQAARRLLAHAGLGQEPLDAVVHAEGAAPACPGGWTFVMVTDRTELDDQLHGEFVDAGAVSREAQVHADIAEHLRELLARGPPLRLHADPQVPAARGRDEMPVLLGARRRDRDHRRGAPHPVRHARAEHAPGAAERRVHGLHRHAADRRRGAHPAGVRRLRLDLQLPRRDRGRRDGPALLREPDPRAADRQRGLRRGAERAPRGGRARRRGRGAARPPLRARVRSSSPGPSGCGRSRATSCGTSSAAASTARRCSSSIDKATAVRMYDLVREEWADLPRRAAGRARRAARARAGLARRAGSS